MRDFVLQQIGHNVTEIKGLRFSGTREVHSFIYFQGPVLLHGREEPGGTCIVYPKGYEHDYVTLDGFLNSYVGFWGSDDIFSSLPLKLARPLHPFNCGEINELLHRIYIENSERRVGCAEQIQALITALLVAAARGTELAGDRQKHPRDLDEMTRLRNKYLADPLNAPDIDDLIRSSGFSRTHFYRLYSALFHSSPKNDLISLKLEKSRELMRENPDIKISAIALECGFSNVPYFFRLFKKHFGYTPKDYASALKISV